MYHVPCEMNRTDMFSQISVTENILVSVETDSLN